MKQQPETITSIATIFQNIKGIYKADKNAIKLDPSQEFQEYTNYLISQGLEINNLQLSKFQLKNGLSYIGLQATKSIKQGESLISLPKKLLLSTKIAYFSEIQQIFDTYPQFFSSMYSNQWQDRILLTYCLYQYQLGKKSQWYYLISNLPKDIDYLIFWNEEEIINLNDSELKFMAQQQLNEFNNLYQILSAILDKYPQFFNKETYTYENIKWIYIHLVSRTFGADLAFDCFVPFCEMLNHENTNVRYKGISMEEKLNEKKLDEQQQQQQCDESDKSDYLSDLDLDEDFQYSQDTLNAIEAHKNTKPKYLQIKEEIENSKNQIDFKNEQQVIQFEEFQQKQNKRLEIQIQYLQIKRWLQENLNLKDNFSIFFVENILQYVISIITQYENDKISYENIMQKIKQANYDSEIYLEYLKQYDKKNHNINEYEQKQFNSQSQQQLPTVEQIFEWEKEENEQYFKSYENWKDDQFDIFTIKCSNQDYYEQDAQAYFSYGVLSNRSLLLRYGFALEYNQYEQINVKLDYLDSHHFISDIINYFNLPKNKKFKITYNKINEDLLMYFRVQSWNPNKGIKYLFNRQYFTEIDQALIVLKEFLNKKFTESLKQEEDKLLNPNLGYHHYFAQVFKIEQQRIIESQIEALELLKAKLNNEVMQIQKFSWTNNLVTHFLNHN